MFPTVLVPANTSERAIAPRSASPANPTPLKVFIPTLAAGRQFIPECMGTLACFSWLRYLIFFGRFNMPFIQLSFPPVNIPPYFLGLHRFFLIDSQTFTLPVSAISLGGTKEIIFFRSLGLRMKYSNLVFKGLS